MLITISYGIGASAFCALIVLMLLRRKPQGLGLYILVACVLTMLWASAAAVQYWWMPGVAHSLDSIRSASWIFVLATVLTRGREHGSHSGAGASLLVIAATTSIVVVADDLFFLFVPPGSTTFVASQILGRILIAVCGILIVENLLRNTPANRRWHVLPLCIAMGTMFAYDLYVFAEAVVLQRLDPALLVGRGIVLALIVPLLALTMARNPGWRIEIHVSRRIVFHTATLIAAGVFLVLASGGAALIGRLPGQWATISEVAFFCGSIIVLMTVLTTESVRSRLKRQISENFFSTRYDYRVEWMRCVATLSSVGETLPIRAIRAMADAVDSPGGALWMERLDGVFGVVQILNMKLEESSIEPHSSSFIAGFRRGQRIQEFGSGGSLIESANPAWATHQAAAWLAVPLVRVDHLIGFMVIARPRAPTTLNWETSELLLAIGQQVASYLAEERATQELLDSKSLIEYSTKFSFVAHDIKNIAGQLAMIVANMSRFGDQPEFRNDLVRGMKSSIAKLQDLLDKLRPSKQEIDTIATCDPAMVIEEIIEKLDRTGVSFQTETQSPSLACISQSNLSAILTHIITNAKEASAPGDEVTIRLGGRGGRVVIEVMDHGCGMSPDFVRNELFVPLRSTKINGHGIGAYQARNLVRAAKGELEVTSAVGRGTTIRILLPQSDVTMAESLDAVDAR